MVNNPLQAGQLLGTGGGTTGSLLLDGRADIGAAYGLRKLISSYNGNLIRIRRSSDNSEQDFTFLPLTGVLDTAAIATFVGGDIASIVTWYDQSGNGEDATQATATKQPTYTGSVLNSRAVATFDGGDLLRKTFGSALSQPNTIFCVYKFNSGETDTERVFDGSSGSNTHLYQIDTGDSIIANAGLSIAFNTTPKRGQARILTALFNTTASDGRIDGVDVTVGASTGSNTLGGITLGAAGFADSLFLNGFIAELVIMNSAVSSTDILKMEKNLGSYYGITI